MGFRLTVVDGRTLCRHGLAGVVEHHPDLELVGEASSLAEGRAQVAAHRPDAVVLAAALPDGDGLALCREIRERHPGTGVVVMASSDGDAPLFRAMDAKASAHVPRSAGLPELLSAIRHAAVAPASFTASGLAGVLARRGEREQLLSPRELQTLQLMMHGLSIAEMARRMHLSHSTAKTYTARIYDKLGAANRAQALMAALRLGLVEEPAGPVARPAGRDTTSRPTNPTKTRPFAVDSHRAG
ncbi:response regulator transcription factor [Actinocorallia populi]|uniref:response regulator transcription factor n=1 Tax=Actinocorallia populi TaxID=2079200 RepID=UPI000D089F46|nr:response regulator transcription factor [Actinocorallia populi]